MSPLVVNTDCSVPIERMFQYVPEVSWSGLELAADTPPVPSGSPDEPSSPSEMCPWIQTYELSP